MKDITPTHQIAQVIDIQEEKKLENEALALVDLHDFIKAHPDTPVKEIAKFMPPVDARVVSKAIKLLAIRDRSISKEDRESTQKQADSIEAKYRAVKWGKR